MNTRLVLGCLLSALLFWPCSSAPAQETLLEEVVPIFQSRCLSCHNDVDRKGDFSLQTAEDALESGFVEPGSSANSQLIELVTSQDGSAQMPKDGSPLTQEEVAIIREWIDSGAKWPEGYTIAESEVADFDWWSFQPIRRPEVPAIEDAWIRSPVDAFILEALRERGFSPSKPADRRTLIRRVTYDLTGLPPSVEEVEQFVRDSEPGAYERVVDRLLKSKQYGERWARHWLDVVKYADTCGYDKDKLRPNAWPYRDYVVRSFNEDKRYERFVQEQIAGDVLFPGEPDGILGLGFVAAGPWDFIGHVEVPESKVDGQVARNLDRDDMVSNTLNTFCSVTIQCARCHNHKFDPITQEHYYGLQSVFAAVDRAERPFESDPEVEKKREELEAQQKSHHEARDAIQAEVAKAGGARLGELKKRLVDLEAKAKTTKQPEYGYHSQIVPKPDTAKWVELKLERVSEVSRVVLRPCHDEFAGIGGGFGFPVRFKVDVASGNDEWVTVLDETARDFPNPGLMPVTVEILGQVCDRVRVTATRLAERQNDYILALAELQVFDRDGKNLARSGAVSALDSIEAPVRWRKTNLVDGLFPKVADPKAERQLVELQKEHTELMRSIETPELVARRDKAEAGLKQTATELSGLPEGRMVYAAATHFKPQGGFKPTKGRLRAISVLRRGDILRPGAKATPGALPLGSNLEWQIDPARNEGERRADLARWLTSKEHPLVWRSIVNRIWQYHFGQGIVETPNDFGRMGATPTHPKLLDWLACEFRDGDQSFKQMHRLIVTSSVYRQASTANPEFAEMDGSNRFLWRMNRRRLTAEEIRDSILSVSGSLNQTMGGPGFYLFKLEKTEHSPHYEYHKFDPADESTHRRSIYRFIVRSQPDPWMTTLDCADSSQSTPRRNETLTSLQALSLLNNRFNLEMAKRFAARVEQEESDLERRIRRAVGLATQRPASDQEVREMREYAGQHGMENLCRILFNLSEFVFLD